MNDLRVAAQQALEALEIGWSTTHTGKDARELGMKAITALRAALADPVQEPVASLMTNIQSGDMEVVWNDDGFDRELWHETPLYTALPQRKPLTEQQIWDAVQHSVVGRIGMPSKAIDVARAVERAHGIGE